MNSEMKSLINRYETFENFSKHICLHKIVIDGKDHLKCIYRYLKFKLHTRNISLS